MTVKRPLTNVLFAVAALLICACQAELSGSDATTAPIDASRQVKVLTSGGFTAAYNILAPQFEQTTGIALVTAYGASSGGAPDSIPSRLSRGEAADVIILSRSSLDNLTGLGQVRPASRTDLARSAIGMAVRSGAPKPDISTRDAFIRAVLTAESIGYSASASGTYLSTVLFPQLGIWEQIEPRSKRISSERVASVVARGEVEIGFQQISEILPIDGVDYVGPLPDDVQLITTFSAGITQRAQNISAATALIEYLSSADVAKTIAATGLIPVASIGEK
ncbi:MAG: substrate-binding domain-containing protein [Woeseiaceae bacterium]|nr:substrate-binding domain-containing protein [Woeseiaceae bacterium]